MEDINNNCNNYTTIHDFFQNNGVGDYRIQCVYGDVTYVTDVLHAGDKFWSDDFIDSHFNREIKMKPQIELLAKDYTGNKLPISMLLDKDIIKITECQKKIKSVEAESESGDLVNNKQKRIKCYKTELSYDDIRIYNNDKISTFSFEHSAANDPNYHLEVTFTKINDDKPGFWQKLRHMFS